MPEARKIIPNARHEATDIGEGFIWGAVALMIGVLLLCATVVLWLFPQSASDRKLHLPLPVFPAPRLQPSPPADWQVLHAREMRRLNSAGWVDKAHGVVHIPIAEALREVAQQGIPDWPAAPAQPP